MTTKCYLSAILSMSYSFLLRRPCIRATELPFFTALYTGSSSSGSSSGASATNAAVTAAATGNASSNSSSIAKARTWALRLLRDGLRTSQDLGLAARKHAAPLLLALFDAPPAAVQSHNNSSSTNNSSGSTNEEPQQLLALQVLTALAGLKRGGARYLLCRVGVVAWARLVLSRDSEHASSTSSSSKRAGNTAVSIFQQQSLLTSAVKASLLTLLTELLEAGLALRTRPSLLLEEYLLLAPAVARCALSAPVTAATAAATAAAAANAVQARNSSSVDGGADGSGSSGAVGSKRARAAAAAGPALVCAAVQLLAATAQAAAAATAAAEQQTSNDSSSSATNGLPVAQLQLPLSTVRALRVVVTRTAAPAATAALLSLICCPGAVQAHGSASDVVAVLQWCVTCNSSNSSSSSNSISAQQAAGLLQLLHAMLTSEVTSGSNVASALAADAAVMRAVMALPLSTTAATATTAAAAVTTDSGSNSDTVNGVADAISSHTVAQGELCMLTVRIAVVVCGASPLSMDHGTQQQQQQLAAVAAAVMSTLLARHSDNNSSSSSSGCSRSVQSQAEAWCATAAWSCMRRLMLHSSSSSSSSSSDSSSAQSVVEMLTAVPPAVARDATVQSLVTSLQTTLTVSDAPRTVTVAAAQPLSQSSGIKRKQPVVVSGSKSAAKKRKSVNGR
jgi:trimeric autotransporter adhesin